MPDALSRPSETRKIIPGTIQPLFWPSLRPDRDSSWHGHVSFAHWLIAEVKPDVLVELGTHNGISFAAFCNAVAQEGLRTQCYALDTWDGDVPGGYFGEEIFEDVANFTSSRFPQNATLLRCYFDAALGRFAPGSIDVLHIDGNHTYEAVSHDFKTWLPKMSNRGIVLFHDTDVYGDEQFGVWRLWSEVSKIYPHFRFNHSSGLGVMAVGSDIPPAIAELFDMEAAPGGDVVRSTFEMASAKAQAVGSALRRAEAERYLESLGAERTNLALNCCTLQSSIESGTTPGAYGGVDGLITGRYGFHTALELDPWWTVDLGSEQTIDEIVVLNRLDNGCKFRSRGLEVSLSGDLQSWRAIFHHKGSAFGGIDGQPLRIAVHGEHSRYVRLALSGLKYLHLDQVFIYGPKRS